MLVPREVVNDRKGGRNEREERELDVPYPQICLRILQDHLEIDAGQARGATRDQDGEETGDGIHQMGCGLPPGASNALYLHDADAYG